MEETIKKIIKWTLEYLNMDSEDARDLIYKLEWPSQDIGL